MSELTPDVLSRLEEEAEEYRCGGLIPLCSANQFVALLTAARERDVLRSKLEDAAAEQSRNESLRVQRLVDRVTELEKALRVYANCGYPFVEQHAKQALAGKGGLHD